jgi:hypothetical protein
VRHFQHTYVYVNLRKPPVVTLLSGENKGKERTKQTINKDVSRESNKYGNKNIRVEKILKSD